MNKVKMMIWSREYELDVIYDCYEGEEILDSQIDAVKAFSISEKAIESSLEKVKNYCLEMNHEEIGSNNIENIFKYVVPKYLYVPREKEKHVVAIMCNYRFDPENGIAVVFENERFKEIGMQDIIL